MRETQTPVLRASASREVAYPVEQVWSAMATLLPYCSVCDVSTVVDSAGGLKLGSRFRAFRGRIAERPPGSDAPDGGMPGEVVDWSPRKSVATRLEADSESVLVTVEMVAASPDTTLVTIGVGVSPRMRGRLAMAMTRTSYLNMARRTVEGEIEKLPAHLALLGEHEVG